MMYSTMSDNSIITKALLKIRGAVVGNNTKQYVDEMRYKLAKQEYDKLFLNGKLKKGVTEEQLNSVRADYEECQIMMFQ